MRVWTRSLFQSDGKAGRIRYERLVFAYFEPRSIPWSIARNNFERFIFSWCEMADHMLIWHSKPTPCLGTSFSDRNRGSKTDCVDPNQWTFDSMAEWSPVQYLYCSGSQSTKNLSTGEHRARAAESLISCYSIEEWHDQAYKSEAGHSGRCRRTHK